MSSGINVLLFLKMQHLRCALVAFLSGICIAFVIIPLAKGHKISLERISGSSPIIRAVEILAHYYQKSYRLFLIYRTYIIIIFSKRKKISWFQR